MAASPDNPGVVARPPLLYGAAFLVVLLFRWFWPMPIYAQAVTLWPGLALVAVGVSSGPFRFSRNPLYLSLTLIYLGLTLAFNTWWGIVVLVPLLITMHRGVVLREERYLERKFGESYREYRSQVRRYF